MKLCEEDLQVYIFKFKERNVDIYCQSRDMACFHNLQGKLELVTLML